jgi:hypothetical protein
MAKQPSNVSLFLRIALVLLVGGLLYRLIVPRNAIGDSLPDLKVAGWLNGPPPELNGKIVLVDVFATW